MALIAASDGQGASRNTNVVHQTSDYTIMFRYLISTPVSGGYRTGFATFDAGYTVWAGFWSEIDSNTHYLEVTDGVTPLRVTMASPLTLNREYHIAYVRSGFDHRLYVDGTLLGGIIHDITHDGFAPTPAFSTLRIGYDGFSKDSGAEWRDVFEYNAALTAAEIAAQALSPTVVRTMTLRTNTPLDTDLLDTSGNSNHWSATGGATTAPSVTVAANGSPANAKTIPSLPFNEVVNAHANGITYALWYKYTAVAGDVMIGGWGFGDLTTYKPFAEVLITNGTVTWMVDQADGPDNNKRFQFAVTPGETYWIVFRPNGNPSPATLTVNFERGPGRNFQVGDLFVPPDVNDGFPATGTVFHPTQDYTVRGYIIPFPRGEGGDVLADGTMLFPDDAPADFLKLYNSDFSLKATIPWVTSQSHQIIRTVIGTQNFFAADPATNGLSMRVSRINRAGTILQTWTVTTAIQTLAMAVNNAETILYFSHFSGGVVQIGRYDLAASAPLSNLGGGLAGYGIRDLLVLADDTIVASYSKGGPPAGEVRRYDPAGTLLNTYPIANFYSDNRLAYAIDNSEFWNWAHLDTQPGNPEGWDKSVFRRLRASDGAVLSEVSQMHYSFGTYYGGVTTTPLGAFGSGPTCPFVVLRSQQVALPPTGGGLPPTPQPCPCPPETPPPSGGEPPEEEDEEEVEEVIIIVPVTDPPQAPPGLACVGGGEVVAGVNPAVGIDLCTAEVPVAYMDLTPPGGTLKRYSKVPINVTTADDPRVAQFGTVTRALVNRSGDLRGSTLSPVLIDTDRFLRGLESTDSLVNALLELYISTEAAIRERAVTPLDANLPRRVQSGSVTSAKPLKGLQMQLQASGYLQSLIDLQPPPEYPQRRFTLPTFPNMGNDQTDPISPGNPGMLGKAIPIGYGALTDDHYPVPVGVVPAIFTGQRPIPALNKSLDEYVIFGHAPTQFHSLFVPTGPGLSQGTVGPGRMRVALPQTGEFYFPGTSEWINAFGNQNYRDINGERLTVFYAEGPRSVLARTGQVPILVNICGVEEVGNGTGRMIDSLARQMLHFLINFWSQNYLTGNWLGHLTVNAASPYARIRSTAFEACKTRSEERVAGGHIGAWLLGRDGQTMMLNALARLFHLHGIDLGENKDGQIIGSMVTPSSAVVRDIVDVTDVLTQSFESDRHRDEIKNRIEGFYARRYSQPLNYGTPPSGEEIPPFPGHEDWVFPLTPDQNAGSITKYGTRKMVLELDMTREQATAEDIRDMQLELRGTGPIVNRFKENLCGTNEDLGDRVTLDHFEGTTATGYVDRSMRVEKYSLDVDAMAVETEHLDLTAFPP